MSRNRFSIQTFNWTNVELKLVKPAFGTGSVLTFNWTNVELKQSRIPPWYSKPTTFNWTNVELKRRLLSSKCQFWRLLIEPMWNWNLRKTRYVSGRENLLIEPMWNWNAAFASFLPVAAPSFNWTNVELKHLSAKFRVNLVRTFNWTNVELKHVFYNAAYRLGFSF